jgi:hypothetical protein
MDVPNSGNVHGRPRAPMDGQNGIVQGRPWASTDARTPGDGWGRQVGVCDVEGEGAGFWVLGF